METPQVKLPNRGRGWGGLLLCPFCPRGAGGDPAGLLGINAWGLVSARELEGGCPG